MDIWMATEEAYKKGYAKGYEDGKKDSEKHGKWVLWEIYNQDKVVGYEWHCSNCNFVAHRWYEIVDKIREGVPYETPDWGWCPKCKCCMDVKG